MNKKTHKIRLQLFLLICLLLASALIFEGFFNKTQTTSEQAKVLENVYGHNYFLEADSGESKQVEEKFKPYFEQTVEWKACKDEKLKKAHLKCAIVLAPLNWGGDLLTEIAPVYDSKINTVENSEQASIHLAITKYESIGEIKRGSLLFNPGGPGASGTQSIADQLKEVPSKLANAYDIVGFDPRGVTAENFGSEPINCYKNNSEYYDDIFKTTGKFPDDFADLIKNGEEDNKCAEITGALTQYVNTDSTVYDINLIRALLKDKRLNFVGFSYGSKLAQQFVNIFPERAGIIVMDGIVSMNSQTLADDQITQAKGFNSVFNKFIAYCLGSQNCPFGDSKTAAKKLIDTYNLLSVYPKDLADGKQLTNTIFSLGLLVPMYSKTLWDYEIQALQSYYNKNDGSKLAALAYLYSDYDGKTFSSNQDMAFSVISCADYPKTNDLTLEDWQKTIDTVKNDAPNVGEFFATPSVCKPLPAQKFVKEKSALTDLATDVILLGNLNDPATPYINAKEMSEQIRRAHLMTIDLDGHCAFMNGYDEVDEAVVNFIMNGKFPDSNKVYLKNTSEKNGGNNAN